MEVLKLCLEPRYLTLLAVFIVISYLIGEVSGEHSSSSPADEDRDARGPDRR